MIPTSMTEVERDRLVELAANKDVLEVGSWLGYSTIAMALAGAVVHAVDWHRGDPQSGPQDSAAHFLEHVKFHDVRNNVIAYIGRSEMVLPVFREGIFEFGFHDSYHGERAVRRDLKFMMWALKPGALLAVHDYGRFGVKEAVDEYGPLVELTETLAVVQKP